MSDDENTGPQAAEIYFKLRCVRRLDGDCLSCVTDRRALGVGRHLRRFLGAKKKVQQKLQRNVSGASKPACS